MYDMSYCGVQPEDECTHCSQREGDVSPRAVEHRLLHQQGPQQPLLGAWFVGWYRIHGNLNIRFPRPISPEFMYEIAPDVLFRQSRSNPISLLGL